MSKHLIDFIGISKSYDSNLVLDDLNLYIRENEFLTLLGPSGCGKTTTLRLLGGFESPDKGQILFDGQVSLVTLPGESGLFTVLENHASLVSALTKGTIEYQRADNAQRETMDIAGGIVDVDRNVVSVCIY
mgnify:CR=1 FL=1